MDFHRAVPTQPQAPRPVAAPEVGMGAKVPEKRSWAPKDGRDILTLGGRLGTNLLLFVVALLIAAVAWLTYASNPLTAEHSYVNRSQLQSIFLNSGQVYFGNVQALNKDYVILTNVFYLQTSNTATTETSKSTTTTPSTTNQNLSLVKLGCELHAPYDQMIINTSQITFWENIQPSGQVAQSIAQFKKQNPNGQTCSNQPATSSTSLQSQSTVNPSAATSTTPKTNQ